MKIERVVVLSILGSIAVLAVAMFISSQLSAQAQPPKRGGAKITKSVIIGEASPGKTSFELPVYGKAEAYNRIELYAEVTGVLQSTNPAFLEGNRFTQGQTLLRIEDSEAKAALMSQRSNYINTLTQVLPDLKLDYADIFQEWQAYLANIEVDKATPAPPTVENAQAKIFLTSRGVFAAYHNLKSTEERLSKYHVRAPFNGVVTQSSIRPGTLVRAGQPLGVFIDPTSFEVEVSISLRYLDFLNEGNEVTLTSPDIEGEWKGSIIRINKGVDATSQTVKAYIGVKANNLREGMYLNGTLQGVELDDVSKVSRRFIIDNNHIWTVNPTDSTLVKKEIEIIEYTDQDALIRGLDQGDWFVNQVAPGAFQGMKVNVTQPEA
ncbi:efflux RND transporter periplasmic adaptor subunit [Phaeocystidibacter luteus]|uniref:Efflux RND transporter periplasmic adaptor subunit n=1 Tax=Phaeocystidibacter luteus TaxID=911197 RepID=A0A6N6RHE3_9FLAO|nr:efflux RND transporter periplasmic adaptor subunit [Phaeocystidibacter luteus]KAB2808692.1 efflux RND transporter periplasmic adaptor subunit [Phaeocystidibacter luteus]